MPVPSAATVGVSKFTESSASAPEKDPGSPRTPKMDDVTERQWRQQPTSEGEDNSGTTTNREEAQQVADAAADAAAGLASIVAVGCVPLLLVLVMAAVARRQVNR